MGRWVLAFVLAAGCGRAEFPAGAYGAGSWHKGNTHAHTTESDGDSPPEAVARWYRDHGYAFLVLSDHDVRVDPTRFASPTGDGFLLIAGTEVTASFGVVPVHVNGLDVARAVAPRSGKTLPETLQRNVDAVRGAHGVPHVNHPNFHWALDADVLAAARGYKLLEIFNGQPDSNSFGGGGRPGMEEVWDVLLSRGRRVYGIAVDDAHHFKGEFAPGRANPGRGWVCVRAPELSSRAVLEALEAGRFYASTGVELEDVRTEGDSLTISIRPRGERLFTTEFIGRGGRLLLRTGENPAVYRLKGGELYVRARVRDSQGGLAWVQPVFPTVSTGTTTD